MKQYNVTGMSCAACQARVEKAVSAVPGVESCAVSLLTNSMGVEGAAAEAAVIAAVEAAGYGASVKGAPATGGLSADDDALKDRETPVLKKRLLHSLGLLAVLMVLSMGHTMAHIPVPAFLENPVSMAITQLLLALWVMAINRKFFTSGFGSLRHGAPNMDTLVAMGSGAAFVYSLAELYLMSAAQGAGDTERLMHYAHNLYFETAAMIPCLITVGKLLEAMSKGRTTDALKSLMKLAPRTAVILRGGQETEVDIGEVQVGDVFIVRPGETVPVDGVGQGRGRSALRRNAEPVGLPESKRHARRGGHDAQPDHPHGKRRRSYQGPHRPHCGQGLGCVRTGGDRDRPRDARGLAAERAELCLRHSPCDRSARDLLPLRARSCDAGRDHGRQRPWRPKRYSVQNSGVAGTCGEARHRGA